MIAPLVPPWSAASAGTAGLLADAGRGSTDVSESVAGWLLSPAGAFVVLALVGAIVYLWIRLRTRALSLAGRRLQAEVEAKTAELLTTVSRLHRAQQEAETTNRLLAEANARLERLSLEDELTGIANRRSLFRRLDEELSRARRSRRPLAFVLFDLDHFKSVNDMLGHEEGDRCLARLGAFLRETMQRRGDLAARYGGEEFALVLPDTPLDGALRVAEEVRAGIEALGLGSEATGLPVTASCAVAAVDPAVPETIAELVRRADGALYRAKQEGRNRVLIASPPVAV